MDEQAEHAAWLETRLWAIQQLVEGVLTGKYPIPDEDSARMIIKTIGEVASGKADAREHP